MLDSPSQNACSTQSNLSELTVTTNLAAETARQKQTSIWRSLLADFQAIDKHDSSVNSRLEILLYPGFHALMIHRFAHALQQRNIPLLPRLISHLGRFLTGIEIHPGATIGKGVFIDHGLGVVVGETAIVGDGVILYQGVTLGGTGKETGKRHPTLGENVVVGAGAKVLGNISIGNNVHIGAGSVVLRDVPDNCIIAGVPGRVIYQESGSERLLTEEFQPDLQAQVIQILFERIKHLETEIEQLQLASHQSCSTRPSLSEQASDRLIEEFLDGAGI